MPSSYVDVAKRGIISGSDSSFMVANGSGVVVTPSFTSLALLSSLAWCKYSHRGCWRGARAPERVYSGAVAIALGVRWGTGQGHV